MRAPRPHRLLAFVLALLLVASVAGCSKQETPPPSPTQTGDTQQTVPTTEQESWKVKLESLYEEMLPDLRNRRGGWDAELASCTEAEALVMKYYFTCLPMEQLMDVDYSLLHDIATHAVFLRENVEWTKALDEEIFLSYVAAPAAEWEELTDFRMHFYDELSTVVDGLSVEEAALKINLWCGQQATYGVSDQRIATPYGMYNGGRGRCAEETDLVVNTLRAVGIPARNCTVTWTTVGDGHAFVEVLLPDGTWHYMGGCEPEAVLDKTWFADRLGTVLAVERRDLSFIGHKDNELFESANGAKVVYINYDPSIYVATRSLTVKVLDKSGKPVPDCTVGVFTPQYGGYWMEHATQITDADGTVTMRLGYGTCAVCAYVDGMNLFAWVGFDDTEATLDRSHPVADNEWQAYEIKYSDAPMTYRQDCTDEEKDAFFGGVNIDEVRNAGLDAAYDEARAGKFPDCTNALKTAGRNFDEIIAFLEKDNDPMRSALVSVLSEKDLREVTADILEDHLLGAEAVRGDLNDEDFIAGILTPVYTLRPMKAERLAAQAMFTDEEMKRFRGNPDTLLDWFGAHMDSNTKHFSMHNPSVDAMVAAGYYREKQTAILSLAKTVGIPVREVPTEDGYYTEWFYMANGQWHRVSEWLDRNAAPIATGTVNIHNDGADTLEGKAIVFLRYAEGGKKSARYGEEALYWIVDVGDPDVYPLDLPTGYYKAFLYDGAEGETTGTLYINSFELKEGQSLDFYFPSLAE